MSSLRLVGRQVRNISYKTVGNAFASPPCTSPICTHNGAGCVYSLDVATVANMGDECLSSRSSALNLIEFLISASFLSWCSEECKVGGVFHSEWQLLWTNTRWKNCSATISTFCLLFYVVFPNCTKGSRCRIVLYFIFLQFISYMEYGVQAQWKVTDEHAETNLHSS